MGENSNDYVAPNLLLCTETKNLCFDDLDSLANDGQKLQENSKVLIFDYGRSVALIDLLPSLSEENFYFMVEREKVFLPKDDYLKRLRTGDLDLNVRREALNWIWKAHVRYGFGELSFCLSINYLDRFLSLYELPRGKTWTIQLLAVACLSLAVKMEEINVPLTVDLQVGEPKFLFEGKTIQRMELLVLSTLRWRMQAYTPCTFIDYFMRKMNLDEITSRQLVSRSIQLILSTIKGYTLTTLESFWMSLESMLLGLSKKCCRMHLCWILQKCITFRGSDTYQTVLTSWNSGLLKLQQQWQCLFQGKGHRQMTLIRQCLASPYKLKRVMKCLELIQDLTLVSGTSATTAAAAVAAASLVPQSPNGVLEAACLSYKSGQGTVGSCPNSVHTSTPDPKRRKLDTKIIS